MKIPSDQLAAFLNVSRKKSFSAASQSLGLTQAALSIRIQKLEDMLEKTLFVRGKAGVQLTESGSKLLVYAETLEKMEADYLADSHLAGELSGELRIGCFSTVGRSLVMPALHPLLAQNGKVQFQYIIKEIQELPKLLFSGEVDMILLDHQLTRDGLIHRHLGMEEYVLIESAKAKIKKEVYLNHDENDFTSYKYFEKIGLPQKKLQRIFLDEIYSVIDGVAFGWGLSVLPLHLIEHDKRIKILSPAKKLRSPVYLIYRDRPYYSRLFLEAVSLLTTQFAHFLPQENETKK